MLHRGKIATNPEVLEVRPLTREDLAVLVDEARGPQADRLGSGAVQRLRDPHHRLARLIAAGLRNEELVIRSGYSHSRILTIRKDPAFIELIAHYRDKVTEAFVEEQETFVELATENMIKAERMLAEKLEIHDEEGTLPSIRELMSIRADSADRLGYGKRATNLNVNVDFAKQIEAAYARTRTVRQIEARTAEQPPAETRTSIPAPQTSDPAVSAERVTFARRA